jgi:putative ABC transport system ATP-binding protein
MDNAYIYTRDLKKVFHMGDQVVRAVDGLSIDLRSNGFVLIQGPSGSGKSTLLYMIGGLDRPTSGKLVVADEALESMDENELALFRRKKVGYIFQSFNLVSTMTAVENVAFPLRFSGVPPKERYERAMTLLDMVGLSDRAKHKPTELSGGQQQRVAVARALINDPAVILADEPTGNLDSKSGFQLMKMLRDLHDEGRTIIMVTHDPRMTSYATDLVFLLDGKIVSEDEFNAANELLRFEE